ncbi:MAG: PD40 domain-containing protein [Bacteroidetes bacterium]|nr:PD40 domain-containing protein [Bacteroidota bacterium]
MMNSLMNRCAIVAGLIVVFAACENADYSAQTDSSDHQIAFQTRRDGNSEIYLVNPDGSGLENLTRHDSLDYHPTGSMDGSMIAYVSRRSEFREIWVMDRDGSNQRQVTDGPGNNIDPSFSPDGATIIYDGTGEDGNTEIFTISLEGGEPTNISNHEAIDSHPFWSPVEDRIVFYSNRANMESDSMDVYVMNADGTNIVRLTEHEADDRYPSWSPDGSQIAFSSTRSGDAEIYIMSAVDGSDVRRITESAEDDLAPAWSPDGSMIAFVSARHGAFEVYVINIDGSGERNLSNHETADSNPRWVPARE